MWSVRNFAHLGPQYLNANPLMYLSTQLPPRVQSQSERWVESLELWIHREKKTDKILDLWQCHSKGQSAKVYGHKSQQKGKLTPVNWCFAGASLETVGILHFFGSVIRLGPWGKH